MALKFQAICAQLQARIVSGQWPEGYKIPTEMELCDHFAVSRVTIRRALDGLVQRGYLQRTRGRGSYVKFQRTLLGGLPPEIRQDDGFYRLLVKERQQATAIDAMRFKITEGKEPEELWHLRALYFSNGKPTSLGDYYISLQFEDLVTNLNEEFTISICSYIATAFDQQSYTTEGRIAAILPCEENAKLLQMEERRACLWWRAYCFLEDGTLIGRCSKIYNGIDYEFALEGKEGVQLV